MKLQDIQSLLMLTPTPSILLDPQGQTKSEGTPWTELMRDLKNPDLFDFQSAYWRRQMEICVKNQKIDFTLSSGRGKIRCWMQTVEDGQGLCFWLSVLSLHDAVVDTADLQEENIQTMKLKEMSEMAATIAHEINNPLTIIYSKVLFFNESLEAGQTIELEELKAGLNKIGLQSERIFKIVNGMRSFSRDARKDPFIMVPLKKVLEDTISLVTSRTRDQGIEVEMPTLSEGLKIHCRPSEMIQVFLNLVTNAIDAMKDSPYPKITIAVQEENDKVQLFFSDTGPGVSVENEEKIFAPFFTTKPVGVGTGIGLSISTRILSAHQGKIKLDRSRGPSCFMIELPKGEALVKVA